MTENIRLKTPIKWAGGKGQLLSQLDHLLPKKFNMYIEPFIGGGALFFHILPSKSVLIDTNLDLINFYTVVRDKPDALIDDLKKHKNDEDYYYSMREKDVSKMDNVERASRFLYLNKTSYNGLWRVNKKGQFNVPFGKYKNPKIVDEQNLKFVSMALKNSEVMLDDFTAVLRYARAGTFVYFDPPYHPLSKTSNFTNYSGKFDEEDQIRLAECFRVLDKMGCFVILSNSDTEFIKMLYAGYDLQIVKARRAINCKANGRGQINEIIVRNFKNS